MFLDFRSDTVTQPTKKMREMMANAVVGDDVYGDDPTMLELEKLACSILDKEAALFVPSGTFGNQLAILTHTQRGDEIIVEENAHIVFHEVGASALIAGVNTKQIRSVDGLMNPEDIKNAIREDDIHYPNTGLICMENANGSGKVIPLENMKQVYDIAKVKNIPVHLDGARLFNAATALGVDPKELSKYSDSVNICLSKGLCAPVGSILAGSNDFINKARKYRKLMGGGLRQAGILAAAGIIALDEMRHRLNEDHENAKHLATLLEKDKRITILKERLDINMVFCKINTDKDPNYIVNRLFVEGIKINGPENGEWRFVTNNDVTKDDVKVLAQTLFKILE
jgi:threonine aldolase